MTIILPRDQLLVPQGWDEWDSGGLKERVNALFVGHGGKTVVLSEHESGGDFIVGLNHPPSPEELGGLEALGLRVYEK